MAERGRGRRRRAEGANDNTKKTRILILSGGAPHAGLLAGALCAVYRAGKTFDVIWASGGGALIALLFAAPKVKCADDALRRVVDFGVSDSIYRWFPVGYKTFFKVGPFTRPFRQMAQHLKVATAPHPFPDVPRPEPGPGNQSRRRLFNDLVDFGFSALTPTTFPFSTGLCEPLPFLEDTVDFERANRPQSPSGFPPNGRAPWFYLNAFNLRLGEIEQFKNGNLSPATIRAALAFPFVYPAQEIGREPYCEGADHDPINLPGLENIVGRDENQLKPPEYYVFDILGSLEKELLRRQHSLWSAFGLSLVVPVASLAVKSLQLWDPEYDKIVRKGRQLGNLVAETKQAKYLSFEIPRRQKGRVLEWSYENAAALFDAGFKSGKELIANYRDSLPKRLDKDECPPPADPSR
jgi:NTE family protein